MEPGPWQIRKRTAIKPKLFLYMVQDIVWIVIHEQHIPVLGYERIGGRTQRGFREPDRLLLVSHSERPVFRYVHYAESPRG